MKKYWAITLLSVFLVSCWHAPDDGDDTITTQEYSNCFNLVIDNQTGAQSIFSNGSYVLKFNYSKATADITVNNLCLTENGSTISFELTGLNWSYDSNGAKNVSVSSVVPMVNGSPLSGYTVENVVFSILERYMGSGEYIPSIYLSMTVNGSYTVVVVQTQYMFFGDTYATNLDTGLYFDNETPYYMVTFDTDTQTATISLINVAFSSAMTAINLEFAGLNYTLSRNGFTIECDSMTPTIDGSLNYNYEISNIKCDATYANGGSLTFDYISLYTERSDYSVQVDLGLLP